jgi:hypothetical protein
VAEKTSLKRGRLATGAVGKTVAVEEATRRRTTIAAAGAAAAVIAIETEIGALVRAEPLSN